MFPTEYFPKKNVFPNKYGSEKIFSGVLISKDVFSRENTIPTTKYFPMNYFSDRIQRKRMRIRNNTFQVNTFRDFIFQQNIAYRRDISVFF